MSIFAKRLSSLKAGTGIRLTSSSGRSITGIIEENDGVESLSVKITSHVCLKYSQIIEFEENEELSFTHLSENPSVSSSNVSPAVNPYGVPSSPMGYPYALPQSPVVNPYAVPQTAVTNPYAVPQSLVANPYAVPQTPAVNTYAAPQSQVANPYAVPQTPAVDPYAIPQPSVADQNAVPQTPAEDQSAELQQPEAEQSESPAEEQNTDQVTPPFTEDTDIPADEELMSDEDDSEEQISSEETSDDKDDASDENTEEASESIAEPETKKQSDNQVYSGKMIKYDFHEGEGIIVLDDDGENICFLSDDITETATKRKIKKMTISNFKEMDLMFKIKNFRGKRYAYDIRKPYDQSSVSSSGGSSKTKVKIAKSEDRITMINKMATSKKYREAIDAAMQLINTDESEEAVKIIVSAYCHLSQSSETDRNKLCDFLDRYSEPFYKSPKTYHVLADAYYSLKEFQKCIEVYDRMFETVESPDKSSVITALHKRSHCYRELEDHASAVKDLSEMLALIDTLEKDTYVNMKENGIYMTIVDSYACLHDYENAEKYAKMIVDSQRQKAALRKISEHMREEENLKLCSGAYEEEPGFRKALDEAYASYSDVYGTENFELTDEMVVSKVRRFGEHDLYAVLTWLCAAARIAESLNLSDVSSFNPDITVSEAVQGIEKAFSYAFDNPLSSECIYNSGYIIGAFEASHKLIPVCHDGLLISALLRTLFNAEPDDYYLEDLVCAAEVTEFGRKYKVLADLLGTLKNFYDNTGCSLGRCIMTDENGNVDVRLELKNRKFIKQWYQGVSGNVKTMLEELINASSDEEEENGFNWGVYSIRFTAKELLERLNGCYDEKSRKYFFIRFLETDDVLLNDDFLPEIQGTFCGIKKMNILSRIERHMDGMRYTLNERLKQLFDEPKVNHNFRSVRLIKKYACDTGDQKLEESSEFEKYGECLLQDKKSFTASLHDFELELDLYESRGTISCDSDDKKNIIDLVGAWFRITSLTGDFGFYRVLLESIKEQININAEDRSNELMSELVGLTVSPDHSVGVCSKDKIASLIEEKNFSSAKFLLDCIRRKDTCEVEDYSAEPLTYFSEFVSENAKNYRLVFGTDKSMGEIVKINSGKSSLEEAIVYYGNNQTEDAAKSAELIRSWIGEAGKTEEPVAAVETLMGLLGFDVSSVTVDPEADDHKHFMVYCRDSEKAFSHCVPAFGSKAVSDGFRVLCLYGKNKTSDLMEIFKENSEVKQVPTLVLLDYTLNMEVRREIAKEIKMQKDLGNVFLIADRVVIFHLARHYSEETVLKRLLAVTVPFSNYQPYDVVSGKKLPQELMTESELLKAGGNSDVLSVSEKYRAEAVRILTAPLAYTGIHMSEETLTMILAETECDPVRIRMAGKSLVSALSDADYAGYYEIDTPCYEVSNVHYLKALAGLKALIADYVEEPEEDEEELTDEEYEPEVSEEDEVNTETDTESETNAEAEMENEAEIVEAETETEYESESETETAPETENVTVEDSEEEMAAEAVESESEFDTEAETAEETEDTETEAVTAEEDEPEVSEEAEVNAETDTESGTDVETETENVSETVEAEAETEYESESEIETAPETEDVTVEDSEEEMAAEVIEEAESETEADVEGAEEFEIETAEVSETESEVEEDDTTGAEEGEL